MVEIVTQFNHIRAQSEGNVTEAHKLAKAAGLPQLVIEYIALSTAWRDYQISFRQLCEIMTTDEALPRFWRAAAFESLGATHPANDLDGRISYLNSAAKMVDDLPPGSLERLYIETCVAAGRNETLGQNRSLEVFSEVASIMITQQWFNAPGRLKAYCDELVKSLGDAEAARDLVTFFQKFEADGAAFSPRQTKFLRDAHGGLFSS